MKYLARKISLGKWKDTEYLNPGDIRADALGSDLRTTADKLSVWECEEDDLENIKLALGLMAKSDKIETFDFVLLSYDLLATNGFDLEHTPEEGNTLVSDLRKRHFNIIRLNLRKLCDIAWCIKKEVTDNQVQRVSKNELRKLVLGALEEGRIERKNLPQKVLEEVQKPI